MSLTSDGQFMALVDMVVNLLKSIYIVGGFSLYNALWVLFIAGLVGFAIKQFITYSRGGD